MDRQFAQPIGYLSCCGESLFLFVVLLSSMSNVVIQLKLLLYSELYKNDSHCYPILFYFGQKEGCRKSIAKYAHLNALTLPKESFTAEREDDSASDPATQGGLRMSVFRQLWDAYVSGVEGLSSGLRTWSGHAMDEFVHPVLAKQFAFV